MTVAEQVSGLSYVFVSVIANAAEQKDRNTNTGAITGGVVGGLVRTMRHTR